MASELKGQTLVDALCKGEAYLDSDLKPHWGTRPAPAATDMGLVTISPRDYDFYEDGELVTRSQAEELLAAERVKYEAIVDSLRIQLDRVNALEADNAANDARVKELSALIDGENCADPDKIDALFRRAETAETQLAAAEKVAQLVVQAEEDKSGDPNFYILLMQTAYDKARAVLGGKPSC